MIKNFVNKRQNNWSGALPAIIVVMNGAPHKSLGISSYLTHYGHPWKIFNPVQTSASKIPAVYEILNNNEATRMEVVMPRKHATFHHTV